ncbi:DUF2183 domain-containing protein [Flavobacteriaceae bacterium TP-CH-4]|uniref:DUF2183 domain-containing protein n=1 Tax=Pelagihabitans pacificus TaxID=2696054 RepID=A0A967AX36_9FLAO|nr:phosphatase domain-containing protein [Pelagihabitans pacificus]NHF60950.1 DUF2183 domain-containing protein [Pelagihabitans pacificus]
MRIFGKKDELQIIAFQTYGTDEHLYLRGRALEDEEIDLAEKGWYGILRNTYRRFETDEIKHAPLDVLLPNGKSVDTFTDKHGYYLLDESLSGLGELTNSEGWLSYELSYSNPFLGRKIKKGNRFPGEMLIPSSTADFGVISDIDDTILHTGVASFLKWKALYNTFFKNASIRIPLEGAAEFYHQLHRGKSGDKANPIFYVSNSPWNLYRYLEFFLNKNRFPKGPILLRSMAATLGNRKTEKPHKTHEIENILNTYPKLRFVLIGDSGEHDADIYKAINERYPNRIIAIYLRDVGHRKRMRRIRMLFKEYHTPVSFVEDSGQAGIHAKQLGLI